LRTLSSHLCLLQAATKNHIYSWFLDLLLDIDIAPHKHCNICLQRSNWVVLLLAVR